MAGIPADGAPMTPGPAVDMPTSTTFELPGYTVERTGLFWGLIGSVEADQGPDRHRPLAQGRRGEGVHQVVDRARHTAWSA